jgi:hypothetical protein
MADNSTYGNIVILSCQCQHDWQDERCGKGKRFHNVCGMKKSNTPEYRCTVCGTKRSK